MNPRNSRQLLLPGVSLAPALPAVLDLTPLPAPTGRQSHIRALLRLRLPDGREIEGARLAEVRGRLTVHPPQSVLHDPRAERSVYRTAEPWGPTLQPLIDAAACAAWSAWSARETGGRPA